MKEKEMVAIAAWIDRVIDAVDDERALATIKSEIAEFCKAFPAPGIAY
jgi:glycine/serine hydroxymethyltransferase